MKQLLLKIRTAHALGLYSIFFVLYYRIQLKLGLFANLLAKIQSPLQQEIDYFNPTNAPIGRIDNPSLDWQDTALYFGWWKRPLTNEPPDWFLNPMNQTQASFDQAWWALKDFNPELGDIKLIWEASRFTWVLSFTERYLSGDKEALVSLNHWLSDWIIKNPPFYGVNWKCGQEAGIRVLHLAMSTLSLNDVNQTSESLLNLIELHLQRIAQTYYYARAQKNNHGTSEAAALWVGGTWLQTCGRTYAKKWEKLGRHCLEKLINQLVEKDGSFSQYSVNYHRVMLDTLSMIEIWRLKLNLPVFSERYLTKAKSATLWLASMVDSSTGDAPNIGANDGAYLFPVGNAEIRDFRLSVQTASVLFFKKAIYGAGPWNARLKLMDISIPTQRLTIQDNKLFSQGGYVVLSQKCTKVIMRYPRFRYRPSQCDMLHVDIWVNGQNILRDSGSFGYHISVEEAQYFSGIQGHNSIQFDDREPMPKLSRFLYGAWPKSKIITPLVESTQEVSCAIAYRDYLGASHQRTLQLAPTHLAVIDNIKGFKDKAILRWHLIFGDWKLEGMKCVHPQWGCLEIISNIPVVRIALIEGWESRYYLEKTKVLVLEVEIQEAGQLITRYKWNL